MNKGTEADGQLAAKQDSLPHGSQEEEAPKVIGERHHWLVSLGLLALLTLVMFGDVLFTSGHVVLSSPEADGFRQFAHWRKFGFEQLREGNLALWNPYLYSGAPFFGGFQSALLYPPNALFLILPLDKALNWSFALHVFLAGAFMYAWANWRKIHPAGCFLAALIFMFGGPFFFHVYAGHLPNLCAMVWAPLLFLAIDGLSRSASLGWSLLGMFATAMQVLAGHPQYVFYTAAAAFIYSAICLRKTQKRWRFFCGLVGIVIGGAGLSAVQLATGLQESAESLRGSGLSYGFASMFSFPPENVLTLLSPYLFGDAKQQLYWGRLNWWESSLFMGVGSLLLATVGAVRGDKQVRRFSVTMFLLMMLLALGKHTPLFNLLYYWVPGFDHYRGIAKFVFLASLFLAILAGVGLDSLLKGRSIPNLLVLGTGVVSIVFIGMAGVLPLESDAASIDWWRSILLAIHRTKECYVPAGSYEDPAYILHAAQITWQGLWICGMTLMVMAVLMWLAGRHRTAVWLLLIATLTELTLFARLSLETFDLDRALFPEIKQLLKSRPGDYRIWCPQTPNAALSLGVGDVWGEDPSVQLRYAQLLTFAQGGDPDRINPYLEITRDNTILDMLRCRFVLVLKGDELTVFERTNYLPHVLLVQRCRTLESRAEILSALTSPMFNPREEVILESIPRPEPATSDEPSTVKLVASSTDSLTIEADTRSPSLLLVTDSFAKGWKATALADSSQTNYQVMPADWCLRAVPLEAGHHLLRLEYAPAGFRVGKWISLISLTIFALLIAIQISRSISAARVKRP